MEPKCQLVLVKGMIDAWDLPVSKGGGVGTLQPREVRRSDCWHKESQNTRQDYPLVSGCFHRWRLLHDRWQKASQNTRQDYPLVSGCFHRWRLLHDCCQLA